jgi:hypothetical protein
MLFLLPYGCGGDSTAVNPAPLPDAVGDAGSEATFDASADAPSEAPSEATVDAPTDAAPDAGDGEPGDVEADVGPDVHLVEGCAPAGTVTIEARVLYDGKAVASAMVMAHCPDGRFGAAIKSDDDGNATLEVPVGGLVTADCPGSLITVGGIEQGGPLELACVDFRPPGARPPATGKPCVYTVLLPSFSGAAGYLVRGTGGEAESPDAGPITLNAFAGVRDIVAYALDGQSQRIASAAKLDAYVSESATVTLGSFNSGVHPASLTLIHPRVEGVYEYTAALETWRGRRIEREEVVATLEDDQSISLSTHFADDIAQWNSATVHYERTDGLSTFSSDLTLREPADDLPFQKEVDLTTGMLPLMSAPSLTAATRPVLDFEQDGPASCIVGSETELIVSLYARHPHYTTEWNLYLPGDTLVPWTLPELEPAVAVSSWSGEQMEVRYIQVIRQTPPDPGTGISVCVSRLTAYAPF